MVKMSFTNNQTAFEYALYMIAASYFDKAVCLSKMTEKNMLVQYKEQNLNKQYQMEDICIDFMDQLAKRLPSNYFYRDVEVRLERIAPGVREINFLDNQHIIAFRAKYAGRKSEIKYRIWSKTPKKRRIHHKAAR